MYNEYAKEADAAVEAERCYMPGGKHEACERVETQTFNVGVPVDVKPEVKVGRIRTECVGRAETKCKCNPDNSECELLIVQKINVRIPVSFDIDTDVGKALLECDCKDCCDK